jgi:hypothetical protein
MAASILARAFDTGFRDPEFHRAAPQPDPIRDRDDFRALLKRLGPTAGDAPK